jgi:serine/threonine protein kinase/WD40 repeat protein
MSESTVDRNPFERLAEEFAERLRRGEHPSLTEYIDRYPEHADDIRDLFPQIALFERYKPAENDLRISSPTPGPPARGDLPEQLGDYRILRYLGEGGMGIVYEAVREMLCSHVALKVMHRRFRNRESYLCRFRTEARSAARLHHTNIVSVFDYGVHDGVCYYAMQYIAGHSLDKVLDDVRRLRQEKEGSPAAATVKSASGQDRPTGLDPRIIPRGAGCPEVDFSRETVTMGLLTGQWSKAPLADGSHDGDTPPLPIASDAIEGAEQIDLWAAKLAGEMCTTMGDEIEGAGTASHALGPEPGRRRAVIPAAHEPPADSIDARGSEDPAPSNSTSTLTGRADARYYREVARLGALVADALAYAHGRGVIHCDIKPPNLLLDPLGNIWITDFGLAKFQDGDDVSQSQDAFGTLCYMAPERFRGVTTAQCDLYALGATLYEMVTLRPPFGGQDQLQLIHRIENDPPVPPRQLERGIPPDLETIVLKALAKSPSDRFASAEQMAAELRRFVEGRPIRSRPIPFYQRFGRWCQRNPGLAAANITAAAVTTLLDIVSTVSAWTYREQRDRIGGQRDEIRQAEIWGREQLFESLTAQARAGRFSRQMGQRFDSLDALDRAARIGRDLKLPPEKFEPLRHEAIACLALPDLRPTGRVIPRPLNVISVAFDPTMTRYALRFKDGTIQVRHLADDHEVARFNGRGDREVKLFFSPDGRRLATTHFPASALTVWDVDRRAVIVNDPGPVSWGHSTRFSPDSRRLAVAHDDGELLVYDLATGQPSRRWRGPGPAHDLAFRGDGARIAVLYARKSATCQILEAQTGRLVRSVPLPAPAYWVAWSPDGTTLAMGGNRTIYLWDAGTGTRRATLEGHTNGGLIAAFHPTGNLLASNGWEGRLWLWDPVLGRPWLNLAGHEWSHGCNFLSHDGRIVLEREDQLSTYQIDPAREYRTLAHPASRPIEYGAPSMRHDGRVLAVGTSLGVVLWDLAHGAELDFLPIGPTTYLQFEPSGDLLTSGGAGVWRWPVRLDSDRGEFRIGPPRQLPLPPGTEQMAADRAGRIVALAGFDRAFVQTPERVFSVGPLDDCRGVAISPDGQWMVTGSHGKNGFQVWRIRDATKVDQIAIDGLIRPSFSPDGRWLMTNHPSCRLWEVGTWRETRQKIGGEGYCLSPDGRQVVVQDASKIIRLVETETGHPLARLESPDLHGVGGATFSPDGSRLVVTTSDGPAVHVWDLRAIRRQLARMGLDWDAPSYSEEDPADPSTPLLPPLKVDYGPLAGQLEHLAESPQSLIERYTARLKKDPHDAEAYHRRARTLANLGRFSEAIADLTHASRLRPDDGRLRFFRGSIYKHLT